MYEQKYRMTYVYVILTVFFLFGSAGFNISLAERKLSGFFAWEINMNSVKIVKM